MSWRILFAALLLGITASVWGGWQLGNWLIEHGPLKSDVFDVFLDLDSPLTLDADGKPYVPMPPQPLANGKLAVPEPLDSMNWEIDPTTNLLAERPPIALATTTAGIRTSDNPARTVTSSSGLQGLAQIGGSHHSNDLHSYEPGTDADRIQSIDLGEAPPPPSQEVEGNVALNRGGSNWQELLQREIAACESVGVFRRSSCKWDARNKYCEANNAWGQVPNCPPKKF